MANDKRFLPLPTQLFCVFPGMNVSLLLQTAVQQAFQSIFGLEMTAESIPLSLNQSDFEGSHTLTTFTFAKTLRQSPVAIGTQLGEYLQKNTSFIPRFNVVQGFLNLTLTDAIWMQTFQDLTADEHFGFQPPNGQTVMVEYSSPNTNKPLHLGHLRNNFLGFAIAQVLKANGYQVFKTNIVNDRGIHICKSMLAYQLSGNGETPESSGMKGDHLAGKYYVEFDKMYKQQIETLKTEGFSHEEAEKQAPAIQQAQAMLLKWEQGDPETVALWQKMNTWVYAGFEETYKRMGVHFDKFYYESQTYLLGKEIVADGLAKDVFYQKPDGSVWVDLTADGLDEKLLLRSDGTSVYITQDLGLADLKFQDFQMQKSVYVVGNEQDYHFKVLFLILQKLGRTYADGLFHLSYGMVDLPSGRMKSREGTVVDADDLMEEVVQTARTKSLELSDLIHTFPNEEQNALFEMLGVGAIKYFLLKVDPVKRMLFNPEESVDLHGNTATFVQYCHARTQAITRKAAEMEPATIPADYVLHEAERKMIVKFTEFPEAVTAAGSRYAPYLVAQYAYELAKTYNYFYDKCSIFRADTPEQLHFRVKLSGETGRILKKAMNLLGIEVPDRM
jgi:arginyl-tRNA synthetase